MSQIIGFLEAMGQDAHLRHATHLEANQALAQARVAPELRAAILSGDQSMLEARLGARINLICALGPARDDEDQERESPARDDEEIHTTFEWRSAASAA